MALELRQSPVSVRDDVESLQRNVLMKSITLVMSALAVALFLEPALFADAGQTTGRANPPLMITSMYGGDLFNHYCATCHGSDGKGHGPAAAALTTPPPDLTLIAQSSGGVYPRAWVAAVIGGISSVPFAPSHGSREMPVWGPIFRYLDANHRATDIRIDNLVAYIETLQSR